MLNVTHSHSQYKDFVLDFLSRYFIDTLQHVTLLTRASLIIKDSFNEQYFYGHTLHGFTACDSFYSLPIHIKCVTGERHDSVTGVCEIKELVELYPEISFYSAAFDSAYDTNAFYLLNMHYGIKPVIDLNSRSSKPDSDDEFVVFDPAIRMLIYTNNII